MTADDKQDRDRQLFDEIAATWCRKDLAPASRAARRRRLQCTLRPIPLGARCRVLEVGCGAGFAAGYLRGRYDEYVGIDHSPKLIDYARAQQDHPGVTFDARPIAEFRPDRSFDVVFMIGVLHHLADLDGDLRHLLSLLKPGGWLAANEPQPGNPLIHLARRVRKRVDGAYSPDQRELSGRDLRGALRDAGFTQIRIIAQGVLSTPFAEVVMRPQWLALPLAHIACAADSVLDPTLGRLLPAVSWNLICVGRRPE